MNVHYEQLTIKKPVKIDTMNALCILRNISFNGEGEVVVFMTILNEKPIRICRMNGAGATSYYLPINKNCTFTMKGKGMVHLSFTDFEYAREEALISYNCDIITEAQRQLKL